MKRFWLGLCVALMSVLSARATVTVSNLRAEQRAGTDLIDIYYDLDSTITTDPSFPVMLFFGEDTNALVVATSVTGASVGVTNGADHHIVWDAFADWGDWKGTTRMSLKVQVGEQNTCPAGGDVSAVAWQVVNDRWVRNFYSDGTVTMIDKNSNLMWLYDVDYFGVANWHDAQDTCANLVYAGYSNWFLPSKDQLLGISNLNSVFGDISGLHWSSTSYSSISSWWVNISTGGSGGNNRGLYERGVLPCRQR